MYENCDGKVTVNNYYYYLFKIMLYYIPVNINQTHAYCGSIFQQKLSNRSFNKEEQNDKTVNNFNCLYALK